MTDQQPLLLTYAQAGKQLTVSAATVRRLVAEGKIPAVMIRRSPRIYQFEVDAYLERAITEGREQAEARAQWHEKTETGSTARPAHRTGGRVSPIRAAEELDALLKPRTAQKRLRSVPNG